MPLEVNIANSADQLIPLGAVNDPQIGLTLLASFGHSEPQAMECVFTRPLLRTADDPADDLLYEFAAGKEKGQVIEVRGELVLRKTRTHEQLGVFENAIVQILSYREADLGAATTGYCSLRLLSGTYRPSGQHDPIEFDVFARVSGSGKKKN